MRGALSRQGDRDREAEGCHRGGIGSATTPNETLHGGNPDSISANGASKVVVRSKSRREDAGDAADDRQVEGIAQVTAGEVKENEDFACVARAKD